MKDKVSKKKKKQPKEIVKTLSQCGFDDLFKLQVFAASVNALRLMRRLKWNTAR